MASHSEAQAEWRFRLENPRSQKQWGFTELQELFETLDEVLLELIEQTEQKANR